MNGASQVFASLAALTLPAASLTLYSVVTGDPNYRPLGVTAEALEFFVETNETAALGIHVAWGQDRTGSLTHADLRNFITDAIIRRTTDYYIKFHEVPGTGIGITFRVGVNRFGPYPPARMAEAIAPVTAALQMTYPTTN